MDEMARVAFCQADRARREERRRRGVREGRPRSAAKADSVAMQLIPDHRAVPLLPRHGDRHGRVRRAGGRSRSSPREPRAQKQRWALDLLTLDKIGAWAITEPGSGSDAFGEHEVDGPARWRRLRAERQQDLHHQRAPSPTRSSSSASWKRRASSRRDRKLLTLRARSRACPDSPRARPMRKMGLHSSPTGELFLQDVRVEPDRLLGESEERAAVGGPLRRQGDSFSDRALRRGRHGARASSSAASSSRWATPASASSSAARSGSSS